MAVLRGHESCMPAAWDIDIKSIECGAQLSTASQKFNEEIKGKTKQKY